MFFRVSHNLPPPAGLATSFKHGEQQHLAELDQSGSNERSATASRTIGGDSLHNRLLGDVRDLLERNMPTRSEKLEARCGGKGSERISCSNVQAIGWSATYPYHPAGPFPLAQCCVSWRGVSARWQLYRAPRSLSPDLAQ